jgi:hypothetical protein
MLSSSVAASKFTSSAPTATPFGLPIPTADRVPTFDFAIRNRLQIELDRRLESLRFAQQVGRGRGIMCPHEPSHARCKSLTTDCAKDSCWRHCCVALAALGYWVACCSLAQGELSRLGRTLVRAPPGTRESQVMLLHASRARPQTCPAIRARSAARSSASSLRLRPLDFALHASPPARLAELLRNAVEAAALGKRAIRADKTLPAELTRTARPGSVFCLPRTACR